MDVDEVMNLPMVIDIFKTFDTLLYEKKNLQVIDFNNVVKIDLLRKVAKVLGSQADGRPTIMKHAVKITDGLLKGVWWITN